MYKREKGNRNQEEVGKKPKSTPTTTERTAKPERRLKRDVGSRLGAAAPKIGGVIRRCASPFALLRAAPSGVLRRGVVVKVGVAKVAPLERGLRHGSCNG
jgi:hypothetical protein